MRAGVSATSGPQLRPDNPYWLSMAPISVPLGVPALIKSLPGASLRKLPRLILPSALRVTLGVRLTKSAALATSPFPLTLTPLIHQQFVFPTSVPMRSSLSVPAKDKLLVKTCEPSSNLRLASPLSHDVLFETVILPGFELKVMPCFLLPKAIERLMV